MVITRTCAESLRLCQYWCGSSIKILSTPREGIQIKFPGLNLGIQTTYIFSSPPSWSCPLTNHPSGYIVSTKLPSSECHLSIHLLNGSDLFNANYPSGNNDRMYLTFVTPSYSLPLESLSVPWPIIRVPETWINLTWYLYLTHNQWNWTIKS